MLILAANILDMVFIDSYQMDFNWPYRPQFLISIKFDDVVVLCKRNFGCRCSPSYEKDMFYIWGGIAHDGIFDIS